ncbi:collagen alpha-2(I) chain-like [Tribolium madens]|uniref:collagen alpha-2(I) chain-like n=1 Tax=Tribolium madens TaxID=41895 RepID=UPI001CF76611|nr:collagen alpha-2(I) chain-like [Tribolium madens]
MNTLFVAVIASLVALSAASPSGILGGAVLAGPAGIAGPIGTLGWGGGAVLTAPTAGAVISGPGLGLAAPLALAAAPIAVAAPLGVGAITNGGGTISASGAGAAIRGPGTAPVVVAGPSGKIAADGLWGPTANIGLNAIGLGKAW